MDTTKLTLHPKSALVIATPSVTVGPLDLQGALVVEGPPVDPPVMLEGRVVNQGWGVEALKEDEGATEEQLIRGFDVVKRETKMVLTTGG